MSLNSRHDGNLQEALEPILRVLSQLGGHFTFTDQQGEQFVIIRKDELEAMKSQSPAVGGRQKELPLKARPVEPEEVEEIAETAEDILNAMNEDIADYKMRQEDEALAQEILAEIEKEEVSMPAEAPLPPPVRVRFEPLRGDLPPELQE